MYIKFNFETRTVTNLPKNIEPRSYASLIYACAKLYLFEINKKNEIKNKVESEKSDISWGNQIRSYILDDSRIKDLRTKHETGNVQAVLDGDLDAFIEKSLKEGF